jgi:hypothetical protein
VAGEESLAPIQLRADTQLAALVVADTEQINTLVAVAELLLELLILVGAAAVALAPLQAMQELRVVVEL